FPCLTSYGFSYIFYHKKCLLFSGLTSGVKVINRGYSAEEKEWKQAEGKAYFVDGPHKGHLKVSFFGPFYGSYVIFELDDDYRYAFVSGPNHDYLWLLSRTPTVSDEVKQRFINKAKAAGFDTEELLFVEQKTLN
uniref:lipocalin family protein n=1 Tax=Methylophaga sp. TaxID=2024840 RepID=UPI003A9550DC